MHWQRQIEFLTPTFSRGAYQDTPEIRAPSIRGMVRWWYRALHGPPAHVGGHHRGWETVWREEKELFGGVGGGATASRLVFRVLEITGHPAEHTTLPHKPSAGQRSPQAAFDPGGTFTLQVTSRLRPLSAMDMRKVENAL